MKILGPLYNLIPKIDDKNRYYILGAVLIVILLLYYFLLMHPCLSNWGTLNAKIATLKGALEQTQESIAKMGFYQSQIAGLQEVLQKSEYEIPMQEEIPLILGGISHLANQNDVKIDQMVPDKSFQELLLTDKDGKYYSFPIQVQARAGYHDIGRFIDQLEKDKTFKNVTLFAIAANPDDPLRHSLNLTIRVVILEKQEGADPAGP